LPGNAFCQKSEMMSKADSAIDVLKARAVGAIDVVGAIFTSFVPPIGSRLVVLRTVYRLALLVQA
jgi:hypothetical protein